MEDERNLSDALAHVLSKHNYTVDVAHDGTSGLDCAMSGIYDAIILDIMLPKLDGISIVKQLREKKISTPILLLTAKDHTQDKIAGLDAGADDYLAKPFDTDELLARIRALLRRKDKIAADVVMRFHDIALNPHQLTMTACAKAVALSKKECHLLEFLISRGAMISTVDMITEKVWGYESDIEYNSVAVYVTLLRRKLRKIQSTVAIRSVRGAGYVLEVPDDH